MKPHLRHHHVAIDAVLSDVKKPYQLSEEMLKQEKSVDGLLEEFIKKLQELVKKNKENVQRHLGVWCKYDSIRAKFEKRELLTKE